MQSYVASTPARFDSVFFVSGCSKVTVISSIRLDRSNIGATSNDSPLLSVGCVMLTRLNKTRHREGSRSYLHRSMSIKHAAYQASFIHTKGKLAFAPTGILITFDGWRVSGFMGQS